MFARYKCVVLNIEQKVYIIQKVEQGILKADIYIEFNIALVCIWISDFLEYLTYFSSHLD